MFKLSAFAATHARRTVELLGNKTPDFIPPSLWPPNSPDLKPVDYKMWSVMQERVYRTKVRDIEDLRQRISQVWDEFYHGINDAAVKEWRRRLRACVVANGGQFEHRL